MNKFSQQKSSKTQHEKVLKNFPKMDLGFVTLNLNIQSCIKFTIYLDSVLFLWPTIEFALNGFKTFQLSLLYLFMFKMIIPILRMPQIYTEHNFTMNRFMSLANQFEVYCYSKKLSTTIETCLLVLRVFLGMFISKNMQEIRNKTTDENTVAGLKLVILWLLYAIQDMIKQNINDMMD